MASKSKPVVHYPLEFNNLVEICSLLQSAYPHFWSYINYSGNHMRRYYLIDFVRLTRKFGLTLFDSRYFRFSLYLAYWLTRIKPSLARITPAQKIELISVPMINGVLSGVFASKTHLGCYVRFPQGTSILEVPKK
jgi:hypothetical protein